MAQEKVANSNRVFELEQVARDPESKSVNCPLCAYSMGSTTNPAPLGQTTCPRCDHEFEVCD